MDGELGMTRDDTVIAEDEVAHTPSATMDDASGSCTTLEDNSPGCFPARIYGVIAEHLIFQSAFGTCASLDIANKSTHVRVKPVLWRIICVKTEENATAFWGDKPQREMMLRAGQGFIRDAARDASCIPNPLADLRPLVVALDSHVIDLGPNQGWAANHRAMDDYRILAPKTSSLVASIESGGPEGATALTATLSLDFRFNVRNLLDLRQALSIRWRFAEASRSSTAHERLFITLQRLLTTESDGGVAKLPPAREANYPSIRQIWVQQRSNDASSPDSYSCLFNSLTPLYKDDSEGIDDPGEQTRSSMTLSIRGDDVLESRMILDAWSATMLNNPNIKDIDLHVRLRHDTTILRPSEDAMDTAAANLFEPLLRSPDVVRRWSDQTHRYIGDIVLQSSGAKASLCLRESADQRLGRFVYIRIATGDVLDNSKAGRLSSVYRVPWGSNVIGEDRLARREHVTPSDSPDA